MKKVHENPVLTVRDRLSTITAVPPSSVQK